jgi:hypothetical protein
LGNSLYGVRANILDVAARPFKQKTRMDEPVGSLTTSAGVTNLYQTGMESPETAFNG